MKSYTLWEEDGDNDIPLVKSFQAEDDQAAYDRIAQLINPHFEKSKSRRRKGKHARKRAKANFSTRAFFGEGYIALIDGKGTRLFPLPREHNWKPKLNGIFRKRRVPRRLLQHHLQAA
ncbi:MAG: hypothetical protein Q7R72_01940 [bacterium]|nr:hypothetical protein [bacterium]